MNKGSIMDLSKSIDFLLDNCGDVMRYRIHKEILKDVLKSEEEDLLEKVFQTPKYKLLESYVKPNGYIGIGMHSADRYQSTKLQDGEAAARLLSNYGIPKNEPIITNFIKALRDDKVLEKEFSYCNPEIERFQNRNRGLRNGTGLMVVINTCQALLGYGDDDIVKEFVDISYRAFESMLSINELSDITEYNEQLKKKYNYPYIEEDTYFPCQYHLETLAHTTSWRNEESINTVVKSINYHDQIMKDGDQITVKHGSKYLNTLWTYTTPFKVFEPNNLSGVVQMKELTHLAMVGGDKIDVVKKSLEIIYEEIVKDGILRPRFESAYRKSRFKENLKYPGPYTEIALEQEHRNDIAIWCEVTFWAVKLISIVENLKNNE